MTDRELNAGFTAVVAGGLVGILPIGLLSLAPGARTDLSDATPFLILFGGAGVAAGLAFRVALAWPVAQP